MIDINVKPCGQKILVALQDKINTKTKPVGALGLLESIALQAGLIQNTLNPVLEKPHIVVFAADHGIAAEGVSAYPQEVTAQMIHNFLTGGAAINVFCRQHNIQLSIVDAGVKGQLPEHSHLISRRIGDGTVSFLSGKAMADKECRKALLLGMGVVDKISASGCNVIGFGEMGIGNTSSASLLASLYCGLPLEQCVGKGTGLDDQRRQEKLKVLQRALEFHQMAADSHPLEVLAIFGGFEIAMMAGAMLKAAERGMIVLVDGFIASAAFLAAHALQPAILEYSFFCHLSEEQGHIKILEHLQVKPILQLNMRLGEGTGVAVAYPIIQSAVNFLNEMASFSEAKVCQEISAKTQI